MIESPWRLRVDHTTRFAYPSPVHSSYNELRLVPQSTGRQITLDSRMAISPPVSTYQYVDYWGTQVTAFDISVSHQHLEVRCTSIVETAASPFPNKVTWRDINGKAQEFVEYLEPTPQTAACKHIRALAEELVTVEPMTTVEAVVQRVNEALVYEKGVTKVGTSASEALHARRGVCQDYTHLAIAILRRIGIPARYVSGYLHPDPDPAVGIEGGGESHAWLEAWTGRWWAVDPTNLTRVGRRHVVVAWGRDYQDVSPVRGIYAGGADHSMTATVRVCRLS